MRITVRKKGLYFHIFINDAMYQIGYNSEESALKSEEYNHFYKLIN